MSISVTFSNVLEEHFVIPWEDRMNFDIFDIMRERIRVNNMWLAIIKNIKHHLWRSENPKIKKRKKIKCKKRLKEITRLLIKEASP